MQWGEATLEFYQGMRRLPEIDFPIRFNSEIFYMAATEIATEKETNAYNDKFDLPSEPTSIKLIPSASGALSEAKVLIKIPANSSEKKTIRVKWMAFGV